MSEVTQLANLESQFKGIHGELKDFIEKAGGELKEVGEVSNETKSAMEKLSTEAEETCKRIDELEARLNRKAQEAEGYKSLGERFIEDERVKSMFSDGGGGAKSARMNVKTITNVYPASTAQPLVPEHRVPGITKEPDRRLTMRDLMPTGRTTSNVVFYPKENVFTNSAAPQYDASPGSIENVVKAESNITFTSAEATVITLAHFILVSRQVLDDAPMLQSYIDNRLMYGLKLEEEDEILNGDGTSGKLDGLVNQAQTFTRGATGDTALDTLRKACTQAQVSEYTVNTFVLNPADWEQIELLKDNENRYLIGNPNSMMGPTVWAKNVIVTNSIAENTFLAAAVSPESMMLWDRQMASIEMSREDSDNFRRNMVTILAEERLALTVFRPQALITGSL